MTGYRYHRIDGRTLTPETDPRGVVHWTEPDAEAVQFRCPCGERLVYVRSPPHTITFDDRGRMTLDGSCGSHERGKEGVRGYRPPNWCHFWIADGRPVMVDDAQCPGGRGGA